MFRRFLVFSKRPNDVGSHPISRSVPAVSHGIWYMRCKRLSTKVKFIVCQHPLLFQHVLYSGSQAFWFHLPRKFSVVTEATHVPLLELCHNWQIFDHARLLLVVVICGNPMQLVLFIWGGREVGSFNSLIAWTLAPPCAAYGRYRGAKGPPCAANFCSWCEALTLRYKFQMF
jgi:hypothetical protein